ncbi:MAG: hypothetical protein K8W52_47160 [Deltaproteobacteria bacterium]|nr:hypothetical protein [Deltaproteobacteria bacterium]
MLSADSLVTDLMFSAKAPLDQALFTETLRPYGEDPKRTLLDMDRLDPRMEMELSPSMPFRRRGERRLLIIDGNVAPLREDPANPIVPLDLRPHKEALITLAETLPIRLGRLFALGSWGDAVLVAKSARDLRGVCLIPWALDPQVDVDGKRRASQLSQQEFEAKIMAFEKRLEELDDAEILLGIKGATFERRGELLVVDVLEPDGTWDQRKSLALEMQLAALDRFSIFPGAPAAPRAPKAEVAAPAKAAAPAKVEPKPEPAPAKPVPAGPPLTTAELGGQVVLVFPAERFDLDVAAALGKRDWDLVVRGSDKLTGEARDRLHRDGGGFVAPLEFLSEVFIDGKPLSRPQFDQAARAVGEGARALEVHLPRFGPVTLIDVAGKGRFVTSLAGHDAAVAALVRG